MKKKKIITETFYMGSRYEFCNQIPENVIDGIIKILSIDGSALVKTKRKIPEEVKSQIPEDVELEIPEETIKDSLWLDIARTVYIWGKPSATELQTSPFHLEKHAKSISSEISSAISVIEGLGYEVLLQKGTTSKEYIVANHIRRVSKQTKNKNYRNVSPLIIKQEHENKGAWGKYCPLDEELSKVIEHLKVISNYVDTATKELSIRVKGRGKRKPSKENHDEMVWQLCNIYKKYTCKKPVSTTTGSNHFRPHQISGDVIPYLEAILPYTYYNRRITPGALQKMLYRMSQDEKYKSLWADTKKII